MADELSAPLGGKKARTPTTTKLARSLPAATAIRRFPLARIGFALIALILGAAVLRVVLVNDPLGGRPVAETSLANATSANRIADNVISDQPPPDTATEETGAQSMTTAGPSNSTGPAIITVGESTPDAEPDASFDIATLNEMGVLPALVEETSLGAIPRVGSDGATPFNSYARAAIGQEASGGRPLVAIVFTGLGLSQSGTLEAIRQLPEGITLAFAPYGETLVESVGVARAEGHEVMLEVPLEPFDYPENDPGPHTLLTNQPPRANLERLFWLMSRFGGYIGVVNYMGARFTSAAADFTPIMEEFGSRGLGYLDDGTSNRSLAAQLAAANRVPYARADLEIDSNPSRAAILNALGRLEQEARENGSAVGTASALPVTISTVAEWANSLQDSDLLLVPVSALMSADR